MPKKYSDVLPVLWPTIAPKVRASQETCLIMLEGLNAPLKTHSVEEFSVLLSKELEFCLRAYWGISSNDEGNDLVIEEMMEVIWNYYKARLGIKEIRLAFKLSTLNCFDFDPKLYYGRVTIPHLVDLLGEYLKYRSHIISAYENAIQEQPKQLPPADMEHWNKKSMIEGLQNMAAREEGLPLLYIWAGYYEKLSDSQLLVLTKEQKISLWDQAKTLLTNELKDEIETERSAFIRRELQGRLSKLVVDDDDENNKARRTIIAEKLAVKQWLEENRDKILSGEIFSGIT